MEDNSIMCKKLMIENDELKRALALSLNKPLIKKLNDALKRIDSGNFITEEEFFKGFKFF
ncbi:MAG: hypothetical protein AABW81_00790 [Nanoarchaeota archaeon]